MLRSFRKGVIENHSIDISVGRDLPSEVERFAGINLLECVFLAGNWMRNGSGL